jgi:YHS domain-containing protein
MKRILLISSFALYLSPLFGQSEVFIKSEEAIHGYDPVAYFKVSKPVEGKDALSYTWKGAVWKFSSEENRKAFKAAPEKFAPQFGGYCAYGMGDEEGHKASTSPDAWAIVDGKLYLNYSTDVQKLWKADQKMFIENANKNWPIVKSEKD